MARGRDSCSVFAWLAAVASLLLPIDRVGASWVPRPLKFYQTLQRPASDQSTAGRQRFQHFESHRLKDGSGLELQWDVEADDADSILALDGDAGVRMLSCSSSRLVLFIPHDRDKQEMAAWRYITASDGLHNCAHLAGTDLYSRVKHVESIHDAQRTPTTGKIATFRVSVLPSLSHIFPRCHFSFSLLPAEAFQGAKMPYSSIDKPASDSDVRPKDGSAARRLSHWFSSSGKPRVENSFVADAGNRANSMINLTVPRELSNLSWNWDYKANSTKSPQFKYTFPGGLGYMRLYKPYLRAHLGIHINFTSHFQDVTKPPHVEMVAKLKGYADFNADVAAIIDFNTDHSASVLDDLLRWIHIPGLPNATSEGLSPLRFFFGSTPLTLKPGFNCTMKAYHLGQLRGSLHASLSTRLQLEGTLAFDTKTGFETNFSARALDVHFSPPSWMFVTQRFELGILLEPQLWIRGNFGALRDMELGVGLQPYINLSVSQDTGSQGSRLKLAEFVAYPFCITGLHERGRYAVEIHANGMVERTSEQLYGSNDIMQFNDDPQVFQFGSVSRQDLPNSQVQVVLLRDGHKIGKGKVHCLPDANAACWLSPVSVDVVDDTGMSNMTVKLSLFWQPSAVGAVLRSFKSVTAVFPLVTLSGTLAARLNNPAVLKTAVLQFRHGGRVFSMPLITTALNSTMLLRSLVIHELGAASTETWTSLQGKDMVEILVDGEVVAQGPVPAISLGQGSGSISSIGTMAGSFGVSVHSSTLHIPVMTSLYAPGGTKGPMLGTAKLELTLQPPSQAAFFIFPSDARERVTSRMYSFQWVVGTIKGSGNHTFFLSVKSIADDGSILGTDLLHVVHLRCVTESSFAAEAHQYFGGAAPCVFTYEAAIPRKLSGKRAFLVINWQDAQMSPHEVASPLLEFVTQSSRRLRSAQLDLGASGPLSEIIGTAFQRSKGATNHDHLHGLASHCRRKPQRYSIGVGMNVVAHAKNLMLPAGMNLASPEGPGAEVSDSTWTANSLPFLGPGMHTMHTKLSKLLPKGLCDGGLCEGVIPGCQGTEMSPVNVKQVVFKLSRSFRWREHVGPRLRHIVAYGLALLPSSLDIFTERLEEAAKLHSHRNIAASKSSSVGGKRSAASFAAHAAQADVKAEAQEAVLQIGGADASAFNAGTAASPWSSNMFLENAAQSHALGDALPAIARSNATSGRRLSGAMKSIRDAAETHAAKLHPDRWEVENFSDSGGLFPEEGVGIEFTTFRVDFREPPPYPLSEQLIRSLVDGGAFHGLEDGREAELGSIKVVATELRDAPVLPPARAPPTPQTVQAWAANKKSRRPTWLHASISLQQTALLTASVVAAFAGLSSLAIVRWHRGKGSSSGGTCCSRSSGQSHNHLTSDGAPPTRRLYARLSSSVGCGEACEENKNFILACEAR